MTVVGIDPDTKQLVWVYSESNNYIHLKAKGKDADSRFPDLLRQLREEIEDNAFKYVRWTYIELPPMGVNPRSTINQARVVGAIEAEFLRAGIPYSLVDPGTWKKGLIGKGNADKDLIKKWAVANLDLPDSLQQDLYDAACIAQWGDLVSSPSVGRV